MDQITLFMTALVFLPAVGALLLAFFPREAEKPMRIFTLGVTVATLLVSLWLAFGPGPSRFEVGQAEMQNLFAIPWIPSFNIHYMLGLDGISFPLVLLTTDLPPARSAGGAALQAAQGADKIVFDAVEMLSPAGLRRLAHYAEHGPDGVPPGT